MSDLKTTYTLDYLGWKPWVARSVDTGLPEPLHARAAEAVASRQNSDYIAVLTNDFQAWRARDVVHHYTFADDSDAQIAYREFGSVVASRINGCVFCASVHARIYAQKSGNREVIDAFLQDGLQAALPAPEQAIADAGAVLTQDPESFGAEEVRKLRDQGFSNEQILDILNYNAFFANANRLMLTLGEPEFLRSYRG